MYNENFNILKKYNRKYLFAMFDVLHSKSEFQNVFINDFFKRIVFRNLKYKKRFKFNMNEDFNKLIEKLKSNLNYNQNEQGNKLSIN